MINITHFGNSYQPLNPFHGPKSSMKQFKMWILSIILVNLILSSDVMVQAQQNPTISFITKEKVVEIGDTLTLSCTVQFSNDYPVHWIKINSENQDNNLFISRGSTVNIINSRYSVTVDHSYSPYSSSSTYTLRIDKVQEVDSGRYSCQIITGSASKETAETDVFVRIPPIISDNSTRSVITTIGSNVDLYCNADGYPRPMIHWRREKNKLIPNIGAHWRGNRLTLRNVTKDDRGTYYCVADNGVSSGARRSVGVEIEFLPYVSIERPRYGQALQYDAILSCHVESFPSPSVVWYKDGQALTDNQHYEISIYATSEEFTDTTLKVKRIEKKQYGMYVCKATNKLGYDFKEIELFETVNVICPPACDSYLSFITSASTNQQFIQKWLITSLTLLAVKLFLR